MLAIHRRGRRDALLGTLLGFQLGQHRITQWSGRASQISSAGFEPATFGL
jgi:hypothetical protein